MIRVPGGGLTSGSRVALLAAAALLVVAPGLGAGQASESSEPTPPLGVFTEELRVQVINVDVLVTDAAGRPVPALGREQFKLRVDGEPIPISYFYAESSQPPNPDPPATAATAEPGRDPETPLPSSLEPATERSSHIVLLIDHTRLRASYRRRAFLALRQMIDALGEHQRIALVGIEQGLVFYSDFLVDRAAIGGILDRASEVARRTDVNEMERLAILGELSRGMSGGILARTTLADESIVSRIRGYSAEEHERGVRSLQQIEKVASTLIGVPGRKVIVYVGEGIPTRPGEDLFIEYRNRFSGPERGLPHQNYNTDYNRQVGYYDLTEPMRQLARALNRAGVTLYSIDAAGHHGGDLRSALSEQGATSESISAVDENYRVPLESASKATGGRLLVSSGKLAEQLRDLAAGLRSYYSLGFEPPASWRPGSDHELRVEVEGKGLFVRHAETIRWPRPDEREAGATVAALMYDATDNPLGIRATPGSLVRRDDGAAALPVQLEIPVEKLGLLPQGDRQAGSLAIFVSVRDAVGNPGPVQKVPFTLAIPSDSLEEAIADFAHYSLPIVVRKGDQHVAIGVRDNVNGVFTSIRLDLSPYSRF